MVKAIDLDEAAELALGAYKGEDSVESITFLNQFRPDSILSYIEDFNLTYTNGFFAECKETLFICISGSDKRKHWALNINRSKSVIDKNDPVLSKVYVHTGFLKGAELIQTKINYPEYSMRHIINLDNYKRIVIVGHSLGGAIASILSLLLSYTHETELYRFGCPRVGDSYFNTKLQLKTNVIKTVVNKGDIIPFLPLVPFEYKVNETNVKVDSQEFIFNPLSTHMMKNYQKGIARS